MAEQPQTLEALIAALTTEVSNLRVVAGELKGLLATCQANCLHYREAIYERINNIKSETDQKIEKLVESVGKLCGAHDAGESWRKLLPHWSHVLILLASILAAFFYGKGLH